jgi:zinc/manganese transport system substrate-binding protein
MTTNSTFWGRGVVCVLCFAALLAVGGSALAATPLKVVATTTDLRALVAEIGGHDVVVESLAKGSQDPHFIDAKPSFMVKVSEANLFVATGLGLEAGWLPPILTGARNPAITSGRPGLFEAGNTIDPIEIPGAGATRADGDVHPEGNPHFTLDPLRMAKAGEALAERLAVLDPAHAPAFRQRAASFKARMEAKTKDWQTRVTASGVKGVVTYHRTLNYFLARFGIEGVATLEPVPGVPPTAKHILEVIETVKTRGITVILVENFFDTAAADRVAQDVPTVRVATVPVAVGAAPGIVTLDDLYEALVRALERKSA